MQSSIINQHGYLGGCLIKDIGRILLEYATNIWSSEVTIARTKWHWHYESDIPLSPVGFTLLFLGLLHAQPLTKKTALLCPSNGHGSQWSDHRWKTLGKIYTLICLPCTAQEEALREERHSHTCLVLFKFKEVMHCSLRPCTRHTCTGIYIAWSVLLNYL